MTQKTTQKSAKNASCPLCTRISINRRKFNLPAMLRKKRVFLPQLLLQVHIFGRDLLRELHEQLCHKKCFANMGSKWQISTKNMDLEPEWLKKKRFFAKRPFSGSESGTPFSGVSGRGASVSWGTCRECSPLQSVVTLLSDWKFLSLFPFY